MRAADARGTIEVGKIADLLLLDRNPLEDPAALRLVAAVFQAGRWVA
jgi:imidazolonepropionase-like amidohydrolase